MIFRVRVTPIVRAVTVCLLVLGLAAGPAAFVHAAPGDPPPPMSLEQIGSSPTITFPGQQGEVSLSIPVPDNLNPDEPRSKVSSMITWATASMTPPGVTAAIPATAVAARPC